jgi:NAD+ diphosphatase
MRPPNYYTHPGFERVGLRRRDLDWIREQVLHPASRLVPVWRTQNLVIEIEGAEPRAAVLAVEAVGSVLGGLADVEDRLGRGEIVFLGVHDERAHFALDISAIEAPLDTMRSPTLAAAGIADAEVRFADLRQLGGRLERREGALLAFARAILFWHSRHRFCGLCGNPTRSEEAGHMRRCTDPACHAMHFPRTDPAVIMLVVDSDRTLLGRNKNFPLPGMYSTLAGFVEPGESLEDAVVREVMEETAVPVLTSRYHSSQPWPFPSSVMIGFQAIAVPGSVVQVGPELEAAGWFTRGDIESGATLVPPSHSISYQLISAWLKGARD